MLLAIISSFLPFLSARVLLMYPNVSLATSLMPWALSQTKIRLLRRDQVKCHTSISGGVFVLCGLCYASQHHRSPILHASRWFSFPAVTQSWLRNYFGMSRTSAYFSKECDGLEEFLRLFDTFWLHFAMVFCPWPSSKMTLAWNSSLIPWLILKPLYIFLWLISIGAAYSYV